LEPCHDGEDHGTKPYLMVFVALSICTAISFVVYMALKQSSPTSSFVIIFSIAVVKALLVAAWFMHLISDWKRVSILIVPALILGPMLMMVLLPDMVLSKLPVVPVPQAQVGVQDMP